VLPSQAHTAPISEGEAADSEDFEIVLKSTEDADVADDVDAMLLDQSEQGRRKAETTTKEQDEQDPDIVLVDADGKTEDERDAKADASGANVGPDAVDSSTVT